MNKTILNGIIIISVVLLFITFLIKPPVEENVQTAPSLQITPLEELTLDPEKSATTSETQKKDEKVPCDNSYLPLIKGVSATFTLTSNTNDKGKIYKSIFTTRVIEASGSSAVVETIEQGATKGERQTLICRESGIYGLPFTKALLSGITNSKKDISNEGLIKSIASSFLLAPSDDALEKRQKFNTSFSTSGKNSPLAGLPITLTFEGSVIANATQNIAGVGVVKTVTTKQDLKPKVENIQLPLPSSLVQIQTKFGQNVGILEHRIKISAGDTGNEIVIRRN